MPSPKTPPAAVPVTEYAELLGPNLTEALAKKGYDTLTPVQASVLAPEHRERDLRISSQTGSGKTLALGFALRDAVAETAPLARGQTPAPRALVIVPTRELAKQVRDELGWLYAPSRLKIASVAGGASYRDEHRSLADGPGVVVGTPGRLLDHLNRGGIDASKVSAVVLDEADRMLDLGFREELEAILGKLPAEHRTHLVSATFAREVKLLADRVQRQPLHVQGTPLGSANTDIDHVIYVVLPRERNDALVNVLLHHVEEQTLVFARTRADVAAITEELSNAGFAAGALSGEMQQLARNRALSAFKRGDIRALVATDVAARGIDVQDIARVVQVDAPTNVDSYTHRSGRTGRAGRKGTSALLIPPAAFRRTVALLERAGVRYRVEPIPTRETIQNAQNERFLNELSAGDEAVPEHVQALAKSLVERGAAETALGRLLARAQRSAGEPRNITAVSLDGSRAKDGPRGKTGREIRRDAPPFARGPRRERESADGYVRRERGAPGGFDAERSAPDGFRAERGAPRDRGTFVPFRVTFGEEQGADARRLVAMLCRRGGVRGSDIGAIRVNRDFSTVEVAAHVARQFADATREPDPRDPGVMVTPLSERAPRREPRDHSSPPSGRPHAPPGRRPGPRSFEQRPSAHEGHAPARHEARPTRHEARPTRHEARPARHEARPRAAEARPARHEARPRAPEARPSRPRIHEAQPNPRATARELARAGDAPPKRQKKAQ